jgi:thiamine-monophosphate kinase
MNMSASGEETFIAQHLAALTDGFPGAFGLTDDCAELMPLPGHALVFKTDPIVEGVHFFGDDAPEDLGWKALAVNVSDLAAKGARPVAYLMALTLPGKPDDAWMARFCGGLQQAQTAFGCVLMGGDTDRAKGTDGKAPLSIAVTMIGEVRSGRMVQRAGARPGDLIYVSGELGGAALGLQLRLDEAYGESWLKAPDRLAALATYLRPRPKIGLRQALQTYARSAMDISDGLIKDLERMCRLTGVGAELKLEALPLAGGVRAALRADAPLAVTLATSGDDYEVLTTVAPEVADDFETMARRSGVSVGQIGHVTAAQDVRLMDGNRAVTEQSSTGYDHFDRAERV